MYTAYWGDTFGPNFDELSGKPRPNFGDILNGPLLDHYGVKYNHSRNHEDSNLFVIGSVARLAQKGSVVCGSGSIRFGERPSEERENYEGVDWRAVRGPLTRQEVIKFGGECPKIYGDPALLLPRFVPEEQKQYNVGVTLHYYHRSEGMKEWLQGSGYHYIDILNFDPIAVAKEISKCERIISTSLHGIIAAHAYGIPAAHVKWDKIPKLHGDNLKFKDHYAAMNLEHKCNYMDDLIFEAGTLPDIDALENEIKKL